MKIAGALSILLALALAIVPQFSDCASQGRALTLADGRQIPMKCHWTARAEIAVAAPLAMTGALLLVSRRRESVRLLSGIGAVAGVAAILLPTALIGVCGNPDMICNSFMRPFLILTGSLVVVMHAVTVALTLRREASSWAYSA